eukprot:TRINITY_DN28303_c0_g2_i1.p1 TRINITY_DN28303_c0_g2~~TRINITY_DN28303_c0_g2_i1.p1  ORF type:complete len:404 (-),score=34.22 TRINITY_DN28303_c0_g2_i1:379-1590(-)
MYCLEVVKWALLVEPVDLANRISFMAACASLPEMFCQWPCSSGFTPLVIQAASLFMFCSLVCVTAIRDELWRERLSRAAMWANCVLHCACAVQWCFGTIMWLAVFLPMLGAKFGTMKILLGRGTSNPFWITALGVPLAYCIGYARTEVLSVTSRQLYMPYAQIAAASSSFLLTALALYSQYLWATAHDRRAFEDSSSWLSIALGRSSPIVPDEKTETEPRAPDSQAEENTLGMYDFEAGLDEEIAAFRVPENWLKRLEEMRERSLARDDAIARAVVSWLNDHNPAAQIEAQPLDRREASLRYWHRRFHRDVPFYLYVSSRKRRSIGEILQRMIRLKRRHVDWKSYRNLSRQDAVNLYVLAQTKLSGRPIEVIATCLQQDPDVWSTGSVTRTWSSFRHFLQRVG